MYSAVNENGAVDVGMVNGSKRRRLWQDRQSETLLFTAENRLTSSETS